MTAIRVLQVVADTDSTDANLAAIELHACLVDAGVEMRTLALGPGSRGQLATSVPVIAPSRRSIAAHTQLRDEQRWAHVVLLRGSEVASVAALVPRSGVRILVLGAEPQTWSEGRRVGTRVRRLASACEFVVVQWTAAVDTVERVLGVDRPRVRMIPPAVPAAGVATTPAANSAARAMAGVEDDRPTVRVLWNSSALAHDGSIGRVRFGSSTFRYLVGDSAAVLPTTLEPELARAAADIVVELGGRGGPSPELLRSVLAGAVPVATRWPALAGLIEQDLTGCTVEPPATDESLAVTVRSLAADPTRRRRLSVAGADRATQEFTASDVVPRWLDTLRSALPSQP